jgi:hypothetical protein
MTEAEAVAQARLDIIVKVLEILRNALQKIDQALPPSPQELSQDDHAGGDPDVTSEVRRVIQCVLTDRIEAAIAELMAASTYTPALAQPVSGGRVRRPGQARRKKKAGRSRTGASKRTG